MFDIKKDKKLPTEVGVNKLTVVGGVTAPSKIRTTAINNKEQKLELAPEAKNREDSFLFEIY